MECGGKSSESVLAGINPKVMQTTTGEQHDNNESEFGQPAVNAQFTQVNHLEQVQRVVDLTISNVTPIRVAYDHPQVTSIAPIYQLQQDVASNDIS